MTPHKKAHTSRAETSGNTQTLTEPSDVQAQANVETGENVNLTYQAPSKAQNHPASILSLILLLSAHSDPLGEIVQDELPPLASELVVDSNKAQLIRNETVFILPTTNADLCTFTRICKSWRRVALSTPSLWSHIVVPLGISRQEEHFRMLSTWLKLSRDAPLFLFFSIGERILEYSGLEPDESLQAILPPDLLATMSRWEILHLSPVSALLVEPKPVVKSLLHTILSDILPSKTDNLKRLYIDGSNDGSQALTTLPLSAFPLLKYLSGPIRPVAEKGNSYRLRYLRGYMRYSHCLALIAHLPELAELDVELHNYDEEDDDSDENSKFPRCTTLSDYSKPATKLVNGPTVKKVALKGETGAITDFLAYISLPYVQIATFDLSEKWSACRSHGDPEQFTDFLRRCSPTLTSLHFTSEVTEDHVATRGLEKANKLTELVLNLDTLSDEGLRSLILPLENSPELANIHGCPNLTSLTIGARNPSCIYRESSSTTTRTLKNLPESKLPKPRFPVEQLVRTVKSHLAQNEHMAINLKVQCHSDDRWKVEKNSELNELQERYKAFRLTIEEHEAKDFVDWDNLRDSEDEFDFDDDEDDDFGYEAYLIRHWFDEDSLDEDEGVDEEEEDS